LVAIVGVARAVHNAKTLSPVITLFFFIDSLLL